MIYIYTIFKNFKILTNYSFEKVWQGIENICWD